MKQIGIAIATSLVWICIYGGSFRLIAGAENNGTDLLKLTVNRLFGSRRIRIAVSAILGVAFFMYLTVQYPRKEVYFYESSDQGMFGVEQPGTNRDFDQVQRRFERYKSNKANKSLVLYRYATPNWKNPWQLLENFRHPRWRLPFRQGRKMPKDYDYSLQELADSSGIVMLSRDRHSYFRCWYATGTGYVHFSPDGTYETINREHMGIGKSRINKWSQDSSGEIILFSGPAKSKTCTPMVYQGITVLVFNDFIGFGSTKLPYIKKSINNIEADTMLYDIYAAVEKKVFDKEVKTTQPFLFYRQVKGLESVFWMLVQGPYMRAKSFVVPYIKFCRSEILLKSPEQALLYLNRRLLYNPFLTDAYLERGKLHFEAKRYGKAIDDFRKVMADKSKSDCPSCVQYLLVMAGSACLELGAYDEARKCFDELATRAPDDARAYAGYGLIFHRERKFDAAIGQFSRAIAIDPKEASFYGNRGMMYAALGNVEAAKKDYDYSLELNPRESSSWYNRGLLCSQQKQYDKAIADFTEALSRSPQRADAYTARGYALFMKRKFDMAREDYDRSLKISPGLSYALHNRGILFMQTGRCKEAIADYGVIIKENPLDLEALIKRGACLSLLGNATAAMADINQAVRQEKKPQEISGTLKIDEVLGMFDRMIEFNPKNKDLYFMKASVIDLLGKDKNGITAQ